MQQYFKKKLIKLIELSFYLIKWMFRYSGLEYIYRKFNPSKNPQPLPTGFIWLITIHVALFGIAFQRYEDKTHKIDYLVNSITAQLGTDRRAYALSRIPKIQWMPCPKKPQILNPKSVYVSLFGADRQYDEQVDYLKNILVDHRDLLRSLNLGYCDLRGTLFMGGDFEASSLIYSNLSQAIFVGVSFKNCEFFNAKFKNAWFNKCNFSGADLLNVDFEKTFFSNCNLKDAKNIKIDQLLKSRSLYKSELQPAWLVDIKKEHPKIMEWPKEGQTLDEVEFLLKRTLPKHLEKIFKEHSSQ